MKKRNLALLATMVFAAMMVGCTPESTDLQVPPQGGETPMQSGGEQMTSLVGTSWTCHLDDVFYVVGWGTVRSILDHTYVFETDSTGMRYSQSLDENNNPVGNPYVFSLTYNYNSETLLCDIVDGGAGDSLQYYYDRQMNALVPTNGSDRIYYRDEIPRTSGTE